MHVEGNARAGPACTAAGDGETQLTRQVDYARQVSRAELTEFRLTARNALRITSESFRRVPWPARPAACARALARRLARARLPVPRS